MPGDLRVPVISLANHLEVMAVIHTESESEESPSDSDMPEPSPTPGREVRDNMDDNQGWTTVRRKGWKSRSTSRDNQRHPETLDVELGRVMCEAEKRLTPNDRIRINKRITALKNKPARRQSDETSETISKGEGPSALDKGKGVDLRNWGALSEVSEDLDLDGQRAALASWNLVRNMAHSSVENSEGESEGTQPIKKNKREPRKARARKASKQDPAKDKRPSRNEQRKDTAERKNLSPVKAMVDKAITLSDKPRKRHRTPKAMEPVEQIDPESYIGLAFKHLDKETKNTSKG